MGSSLALLALAACSAAPAPPAPAPPSSILIGVSAPLTGPDSADGRAALAGARYALAERGGKVEGVSVSLLPIEESPGGRRDPAAAASALSSAAEDPRLVGVVGPLLAASAAGELPVAASSHMPFVSPSVTSSCLTPSPSSAACPPFDSVRPPLLFRMLPPDSFSASALATLARRDVSGGKLAVAWLPNPADVSLADSFSLELGHRGGAAAPRQAVDPRAPSAVSSFLHAALADGAGGVFVAGPAAAGACLLRPAMDAAGFQPGSVLLGGDELMDGDCSRDARGGAVVALRAGPDAEHPAADVSALRASAGSDYGRYSLTAAAATRLLLDAIGRALRAAGGNLPSRAGVRAQLAGSFDALGGPRTRLFSVYALEPAGWAWRESLSV